MKSKILQRLAIFTSTFAIAMNSTAMVSVNAAPRTINSYGVVTATDPTSNATVTIDADDIRANYAAIYQIQQQLSGLDGKTLAWSDELGTYVIKTYKTDENGDVILDDDGNPIVESEEAIGALGTADPTMVVENRTFSSLYAKTVYEGENTAKAPGVQQNGTLVDVLGNGFTSIQVNGRASYADNDTVGTGSSTRNKDSAVTDTTGGDRTDKLNVDHVQYIDPAETLRVGINEKLPTLSNGTKLTASHGQYSSASNGKFALSKNDTDITLGINESITLPAGYYSKNVTLNNGVVNNTETARATISGTVGSIDEQSHNKTFADGNMDVTNADGTYDINKWNASTDPLNLGAKASIILPSGYYSKDILIQNTVKDILGADYDSENGIRYSVKTYDAASSTNGNNSTTNVDINDSDNQNITLGINESVTLPAGYYSKEVTLNNGVADTTTHGSITVSGTIGGIDAEETDITLADGNKHITKSDNTYAITDLDDASNPVNIGAGASFTFPVGYYSKAIKVQNTVKDILGSDIANLTKNTDYQPAANAHGTNTDVAKLTTEHTDLTLGINDSITLPAGYYSKSFVIKNGVRNNVLTDDERKTVSNITGTIGTIDSKDDNSLASSGNLKVTKADGEYTLGSFNTTTNPLTLGAGASIVLPAGYYDNFTITNSVKDILGVASLPKNVKGTYTAAAGNTGTVNDHAALSNDDTTLTLGINEKTTLPAGYYSKEVTINNGVVDRGSVENRIDSVNSNDIPGGYYVPSSLANSVKYQTLITTIGDILGKPWGTGTGETIPTLADINGAGGFGGFDQTALKKVTAISGKTYTGGNNKFLGANGSDGNAKLTADKSYTLSDSTNGTYQLGAGEQLVFPAGFYSKTQTVQNGAKIITSATVASDPNIDTNNAGNNTGTTALSQTAETKINLGIEKKVTLPAGYYTKDVIVNNSVINRGVLTNAVLANGFQAGYYSSDSVTKKDATTYVTSTSDQTIAKNQFLTGDQTILGVKTSNIDAANIKTGVTVQVGDDKDIGRIKKVTGTFTSDGTATKNQILKDQVAYVKGAKVTGSMPNNSTTTSNGTVPGISSTYKNVPTREGANLQFTTATDNVARISIGVPEGYYPGVNSSYVNRPASDFGNASADQVLTGSTFTSSSGLKIAGTMPINPSDGIQSAVSAVGVDNNVYIRMPAAAYLNKASSGYPELVMNKQQLIKQALGGYNFAADATSVGFAASSESKWAEAGGYFHVHMPEGYYGPNDGDTDYSSWAPEVRLTKSQVRELARIGLGTSGSISDSASTASATANGNVGLSGTINLDKNKKLVVAAGYTDGFTVQNVAKDSVTTTSLKAKSITQIASGEFWYNCLYHTGGTTVDYYVGDDHCQYFMHDFSNTISYAGYDMAIVCAVLTSDFETDYGDPQYEPVQMQQARSWEYTDNGGSVTITAHLTSADTVWYPGTENEGHRTWTSTCTYTVYGLDLE